jgi:hypothetical protein
VQVADHEIATGRIGGVMHYFRDKSGRHRFMIALCVQYVCDQNRFSS